MNLIVAGRTLLIRDRRMGDHLWLVLTDPDPVTNYVVVVALVTERSHTDRTVRLVTGDHPFIDRPSNIAYGTATFKLAHKLDDNLRTGKAELSADLAAPILQRVRDGLLASGFTPNVVAEHCRAHFR